MPHDTALLMPQKWDIDGDSSAKIPTQSNTKRTRRDMSRPSLSVTVAPPTATAAVDPSTGHDYP